ncbi:MAG: hypothetical protein A3J10_02690 [Candidatus Sungbacteria bacterium RIFCSPLOWO2_02_FULL_54_10]|uniref:Uncharacterized protein n=1 Tax=Candidatus Sungbacteria bacterium RIFCSPHIGHO2_02_FULL_53_17 TaxID=1802275 RepID=A0A1G2KYJ4_9BACT|nr:MAG: hypothetical protein A3C92_04135 [Candidatus Sungbacteria bacterium RIFCSPHIGHO2_02_FULL_53_17]OHA13868.1 MAG: hypothetical protein A3J10_02690 [Candidatus Sungbacteria bacterium RIFCSPLOWO2_02_FULL_54_10]
MAGFIGSGYELGDANEVSALLDRAMLKCGEGDVTEARKIVNAVRDHVSTTLDLIRRPAVWEQLGQVLSAVMDREKAGSGGAV